MRQISIPLYIPIIVGIVVFWTILTLAERKTDRVFNYTKYIENLETGKFSSTRKGINHYLNSFIKGTQNRIKLSKSVEDELVDKLHQASWKITPQQFYANKIVYPVIYVSLFLLISFTTDNKIIYLLAIISTLTYFYPNYILKQKIKNAKAMRRFELPNYLTPLGLMMFSYTPFQAVKKSQKFAGPFLREFVDQLVVEMEVYPTSTKPFNKFADRLGITEAQTFMTALQQAIKTDPSRSRKIIYSQIDLMRKLREENYLMLIEMKPLKMNIYNFLLMACILIIPVTIMLNILSRVVSGL